MKKFINISLKLVGSLCNLNCKYCYEHKQHGNKNTGYIDANLIIKYIQQTLLNKYEYIHILLHGGEPLLYPKDDMQKILKFCKSYHNIKISLQTNGLLVNSGIIEMFKCYDEKFLFSISLDSKYNVLRGCDTKKIFDNMQLIKQYNMPIGVVCVITKENLHCDDFRNFIMILINEYSVDFLTINKIKTQDDDCYVTELEYCLFLINIFSFWYENKLFKKIKINPFYDILQTKRLCSYYANPHKCNDLLTIYPPFNISGCEHKTHVVEEFQECMTCDIYEFCGSGCLHEKKDDTFCHARHILYNFIKLHIEHQAERRL